MFLQHSGPQRMQPQQASTQPSLLLVVQMRYFNTMHANEEQLETLMSVEAMQTSEDVIVFL